jgi:hypothetical protein
MNYICLITFRPTKIWCKFLNTFTRYKIIIIVDDTSFDLSNFSYDNITFVQIDDDICKRNGYINTNFLIKQISGWDKALYYFGKKNFNYVWFLEDDVFFYNEQTIISIDEKYNNDLLSNSLFKNVNGDKSTWHWKNVNINFPPPYYNGMMCIVRFSKKMMQYIDEYAKKYHTLFFLEALFPTIAMKHKLTCSQPKEFFNIIYRFNWKKHHIDQHSLFHPVKKITRHSFYRKTRKNRNIKSE